METGKVEYAPDYKSKSQVKRIAAQRGNTLTRTNALIKEIDQRQRLEREVIEAAKGWHGKMEVLCDPGELQRFEAGLYKAVVALNEFESQHVIVK